MLTKDLVTNTNHTHWTSARILGTATRVSSPVFKE